MLGPMPASSICEQPGWACLQTAWAEAWPEILPDLLALLSVFTVAVSGWCFCPSSPSPCGILRTRPTVKDDQGQQGDIAVPRALKKRSNSSPLSLGASSGETAMQQTAQILARRAGLGRARVVETAEAASLPVPRDPSSPLPRQARARSDKRAAAGFSRSAPSFLTETRSGAVKPFPASSRRETDTPQTGADVETRRVSSHSPSSPYSSAMESSESIELLLAHKDSLAEVQHKLDHQKREYDECVAKCEEKEEILPKVASSSRSPPLQLKRAPLSRSYSASSGLAAAQGSPKRKFDGVSSGARFYDSVVQRMYSRDQRKRNSKTSESDPATAGAPAPRANECALVSPVSLAPRESKTTKSKPATAEAASGSSATSSTEVGPLSPRQPGSSAGSPDRAGVVGPFQPSPLQASSLFRASTRDLTSTIDIQGTFRVYRARHVVDTISNSI